MGNMTLHTPLNPPRSRVLLGQVAAAAQPFINVAAAAKTLGWDHIRTAKQLARWSQQGYLRRVRRGTYAVVPAAAVMQENVIADPWLLVQSTFRNAYIGGWSAAEHWDLTEQVFTTLLVCTTDRVRRAHLTVGGAVFRARHVPESWFFGTRVQWREGSRILISDPHKTIVDLCADPALGAGIQHVAHCFRAYLQRPDIDLDRLLNYASELGVPTAFKRLGFLCEAAQGPAKIIEQCEAAVTVGLAALDPAMDCPKVSKRWQLRLPTSWQQILRDD
jgi:predicted transcriptional regulator of viral defense system